MHLSITLTTLTNEWEVYEPLHCRDVDAKCSEQWVRHLSW